MLFTAFINRARQAGSLPKHTAKIFRNHGHLHCRCFQRQFLILKKMHISLKHSILQICFSLPIPSTFLSQMYLILFPLIFSSAEKLTINSTQQLDSKPANPLKQCYLSVAAFYLFVTGIIWTLKRRQTKSRLSVLLFVPLCTRLFLPPLTREPWYRGSGRSRDPSVCTLTQPAAPTLLILSSHNAVE